MKLKARQEDAPAYSALIEDEDGVIDRALQILERRVNTASVLDSPRSVKDYLCLRAAGLQHEQFCCLWVDQHHRPINYEVMFRGTLAQTSVYPREVAKRALLLNAAAVIFSHNHPTGSPEPSRADEHLTRTLKCALDLIDVRVLDHIVTGAHRAVSFAERGLL